MLYQVNGLKDIYTVVANERKIGGAIETGYIRLRSGEEFANAIVSHIDMAGAVIYSVTFVTEEGKLFIININDISIISEPAHKYIKNLNNTYYRGLKTAEKLKHLKKLCDLNQGAFTKPFVDEVMKIIEDIGKDTVKKHVEIDFIQEQSKVIQIAKRVS